MEKKSYKPVFILLLLLLVLLLVGGGLAYKLLSARYTPGEQAVTSVQETQTEAAAADEPQPEAQPEAEPESDLTPAPDFKVLDADGNEVRLSDFVGQPVIVNFWATWCPYCIDEMGEFEENWQKYGERVQFMMVDIADGKRETVDQAKTFIEESGYGFPVYFDTELEAAMAYSLSSLPMTLCINSEGEIFTANVGQMRPSVLESIINELLVE
ncbi:MAG: redoxin domain-containing protein [Oscillospiraceae bacterium]|nr:redoxin domain-containing protein [Oscillospiraceae bacterium]